MFCMGNLLGLHTSTYYGKLSYSIAMHVNMHTVFTIKPSPLFHWIFKTHLVFNSLRHRRQVAGITVFRKMQCSLLPHPLDSLKLPQLKAYRSTRQSSASHQHTVVIPKSRTSQQQRSFLASYARLWNSLPASVVDVPSGQSFKSNVHHHLINLRPAQNIWTLAWASLRLLVLLGICPCWPNTNIGRPWKWCRTLSGCMVHYRGADRPWALWTRQYLSRGGGGGGGWARTDSVRSRYEINRYIYSFQSQIY